MINAEPIISKMKNQKINYDKVLKKLIWQAGKRSNGPKSYCIVVVHLVVHKTLEFLTQYADIAIYFANSNIHPKNEYLRRAKVQEQFVEDFNRKTGANVSILKHDEPHKFVKMVKDKNKLADEKEGGLRCTACFEMRLDIVAKAAVEHGYDYFGSAITLSPKKNAQLINELGMDVQKIYDVNYLPSDFKKSKGYERSIEM